MDAFVAVVLFVSGLVHLLPLAGVLGRRRLAAGYGVVIDDAALAVLMRHRAVLFGLSGLLMCGAAFVTAWRTPALAVALASTLAFVVLVRLERCGAPAIARIASIDRMLILLLLPAVVMHAVAGPAT